MQPEWYDDLESVLHSLSNGSLDSTACAMHLSALGYSSEADLEEIMDVETSRSEEAA